MNTAIIGCGYWGPNILRNLDLISNLKIVVDINDKNFEALKIKYPHILFTTDMNMIHELNIDAVAIITPPNTHLEIARNFSNYHLFIEKPLTHSLLDAENLLKIENKNKFNCVGHVFLFSQEIRKLKELIDTNIIKNIESINITRLNFGKYQSCGVEVDLLPHDLSILKFLLNSKLEVKSACYGKINDINVSGCAIIKSENTECIITSSWTSSDKIRTISINTKNGIFEYDMSLPNIIKHYKGRILEKNIAGQLENIEVEYGEEPLLGELKYWINSIKNNNEENIISFKNGYDVVKLIDTIQKVSK